MGTFGLEVGAVPEFEHDRIRFAEGQLDEPLEVGERRRGKARRGLGAVGQHSPATGAIARPETQRQQIEQALRRWPQSLALAGERVGRAVARRRTVVGPRPSQGRTDCQGTGAARRW